MDTLLKIALLLTATDKMSEVVRNATSDSKKRLVDMAKENFAVGASLVAAGKGIVMSMQPAVEAYAKLEAANTDLQASMMDSRGSVDGNFEKIANLAEELGNQLPGTTADFYNLFKTMQENGVKSQSILDDVGRSAAYLAIELKMPYDEAGRFAAKMKEATGVADQEMFQFMDTLNRANSLGVGATELQYAFSRSAGTLKLLGLQGLKSSNDMTVFYATLNRAGMSGETAASSFNNVALALLDKKKFGKFTDLAKDNGLNFQFFDKEGKFMGVDNFVAQFDKMKGLGTKKRAELVNALTGGGSDGQMLNTIITNGAAGYAKMRAEMQKKASLNDKVTVKLKTLASMWEATTGTIENMLAALGKGLEPVLKPLVTLIGNMAGKLKDWLTQNPALAKFISMAVSLVGVAVSIAGVIKVVKSLEIAMTLLNKTVLANPFVWLAAVAVLAISIIYANWDKISAWFKRLWDKVTKIFWKAVDIAKKIIILLNPVLLIYKYWDKISEFFINLWDQVKAVFWKYVTWFYNLHKNFFNAGKNIVLSIWEGIKKFASKPIDAIKDIVTRLRKYLPFSPAKEGPLRDIHKIRLIETIAESIRPDSLIKATGSTLQRFKTNVVHLLSGGVSAQALTLGGGRQGGGSFNVTINLSGSATLQDGQMLKAKLKETFNSLMQQYNANRERKSF